MPLASTKFTPGYDKQSTSYGAEGKWVDGENIRFRYGQPEKIGGWIKLFGDKLIGVVRDQFAWSDLTGTRHLALGTDKKLYIYKEGEIADVTPLRNTETGLTNPFVTTSGSAIVTVTDASHGATAGDFVTFSGASAVGGLDMNAEFEITEVTSSSVYTVTHSSNASSGATGGGSSAVTAAYQISPGPEVNAYGYGWGISAWNGVITPTITDQLNEALDDSETGVDVDDGSKFANGDYILVGQEIMKVTGVSTNTLTVTRGLTNNTGTTAVSAGSHIAAAHADNSVVTLIFDASDTSYIFTGWNIASASSTTTIDGRYWVFENFGEDLLALANNSVLYKWDTSAGPTTRAAIASGNAPTASRHLILSTPDRHVILMGTETTIGSATTQDDLFLRFSSQEDFTTWTPSSTNTAGSFRIQDGSKIMTTVRSRGSILIWTDTSLHSLQFIGAPFVFGLTQIGANCGAVGPHSAVDVNGTTFWMSQNAFYMFDGAIKKLPCSVQDYVFDSFSITSQATVYAGLNTDFNEVTWFYASKDSTFVDRSVTFNYLENVWYTNSLARTTWLDRGVYELPYATEYESTVNGTTPTVLGLTDGASSVYVHEEGTDDDVSAMRCTLQSGDFDIQDGQQLLSISRFIPDFKEQKGSADVLLSFKDYNSITNETTLNGAISAAATSIILTDSTNFPSSGTILIGAELITYTGKTANTLTGCSRGASSTTAATHADDKKVINYSTVRINLSTVTPTTTKIDTRGRGRQGNLLISSDAVGDNWRFGTLRLDVKPDGGR
jgi:hypothetical protein|tara:strand:+ start:77 stop:2419 length:2343 start_codon:yes stop_codon:yes gene_type:complete